MMSEEKEQRAGANHIFVDVIFRVWFSQGNHKAFKCRSEDVVLSSIKQPEADGENPENSKKRGEILKTPVLRVTHFQETHVISNPPEIYLLKTSGLLINKNES